MVSFHVSVSDPYHSGRRSAPMRLLSVSTSRGVAGSCAIVGTSFQDIVDAVGIKKGSLVNYFRPKAELAELIQARFHHGWPKS